MVGKHLRCLSICAPFILAMMTGVAADEIHSLDRHRENVDVSRYPWSAIGKLTNETGGWCSGVVISSEKILTAAHCLFNYRARRYVVADSLHFLLGYRTGQYAVHARIASYDIGPGFDPLRYNETSDADWAVLTVTRSLPSSVTPLRFNRSHSPSGTKAMIAGYPQDRAHAMTADLNCELQDGIADGRWMLHTCRGISGYSGAPILVSGGGNELRIAGIQIAKIGKNGAEKMLAVSVQSIWAQGRDDNNGPDLKSVELTGEPGALCRAPNSQASQRMDDFRDQLGLGSLVTGGLDRLSETGVTLAMFDSLAVLEP